MKTCPQCGQATTFWQRTFGGGLCAACGEKEAAEQARRHREAEQRQLQAAQAAARAAEEARERRTSYRRKCVICSSPFLKEGYVPDSGGNVMTGGNRMRFKTDVFEAHQLQALACMGCGHVSFWIFVDELPQIG